MKFQKNKLIDIRCESNINTILEKKLSSQNRYSGININNEVTSTSSQTAEQTGVLKK